MKKYISVLITVFLVIMIAAPAICTAGAKYGIELWLFSVLPVLLPFIIVSNLLVGLGICDTLAAFVHPLIKRLFHTSIYGTYVVLIGLLCGYPMGVKTISDLVSKNLISNDEAEYLLTFCNNPSPMYMLGYASAILSSDKKTSVMMFIIIYISAYITSVIYRTKKHISGLYFKSIDSDNTTADTNIWTAIETSILNGFITAVKLGGYIIIFSIIVKLLTCLTFIPENIKAATSCIIEITSGAYYISAINISYGFKIVIVTATSMLGGLSVTFQTAGVLSGAHMHMKHYMKYKLVSSGICALLTFVYILIFM